MGNDEFKIWVRGFWKRPVYALPIMLRLCGLSCMWTICWWCEPTIVIVVGSLILIGVSVVVIIAYVWELVKEMTQLVSCDDVSLRWWEMM